MAWTLRIATEHGGFEQWVDLPKAQGWIDQANRLAKTELKGVNAENVDLLRELWQAISYAYLAMDLPPCSDPAYRRGWLAADHPASETSDYRTGTWHGPGSQLWLLMYERPLEDLGASTIVRPIWLRCDGTVDASGLTYRDQHPEGRITNGPYLSPWSYYAWWQQCPSVVPDAACDLIMTPPLGWSWNMAVSLAEALAARGIDGTILESRAFVAVQNVRQARAYHLQLPAELAVLAERSRDELQTARHEDADLGKAMMGSFVGLGAAVLSMTPAFGPFGLGLGLVFGILTALLSELPRATIHLRDAFDRDVPSFERSAISGRLVPATPPTQVVPMPPVALVEQPLLEEQISDGVKRESAGAGGFFAAGAIALLAKLLGLF